MGADELITYVSVFIDSVFCAVSTEKNLNVVFWVTERDEEYIDEAVVGVEPSKV